MNDLDYPYDLLKMKVDDKIYWRWMIQIIEDEWLKISMRIVDDEWSRLSIIHKIYWMTNDLDYSLDLLSDEWFRLFRRFIEWWMIKIYWRWII